MPGNFVFIEGDDKAAAELRGTPGAVDHWLRDVVGDTADYAADRLRMHAPGAIDMLVDSHRLTEELPGNVSTIEAQAGVIPDLAEGAPFNRGLTSTPADWPVFPDIGTGIYGEHHKRITTIPGNFMRFEVPGEVVYAKSIAGQPAQHYSDRAYEDTLAWLPGKLALASREIQLEAHLTP